MKIFFSLNYFLPHRLAGIEVYTFKLALSLQNAGAEVAVLIPFFDSLQNDSYTYEGIHVIRYAENSTEDREMILGKTKPEGLINFVKIILEEKPDLVHFHELSAGRGVNLFHVQAVAAIGIQTILTCHLSTYSCQTGNLVYKDERLCDGIIRTHVCTACAYNARGIHGTKSSLLQSASKLLYAAGINTTHLNSGFGTALGFPFLIEKKKKELLQLAALCSRIVVLTHWYKTILEANGVPADKIQYCAQGLTGKIIEADTNKSTLPLRIVFVGRVSKYKGLHLLLQALQYLPAGKINLTIYGPVTEDEYGKSCREQSAKMENVFWKGTIAPGKVVELISDYDLLCLPSTFSEMSPLVIPEAFAAGIPVLASNVYGNAEQVQDGENGWLFDFKSVSSLKEKLEMLIENPVFIDLAKKNLPVPRSFDAVAVEHLEMYKSVLEEK